MKKVDIEEVESRYRAACKERGIEPVNYSYLKQDEEYIYCIDMTDEGEKIRWKMRNEEYVG